MTAPGRWCVVYADTPDVSGVVALLARSFGPPDRLGVFRIPGFTIDVRRNPDRTGGDHYLDWTTTIEIDAGSGVTDRSAVAFISGVIDRLHDAGHRVGTECEFTTALPPPDTR